MRIITIINKRLLATMAVGVLMAIDTTPASASESTAPTARPASTPLTIDKKTSEDIARVLKGVTFFGTTFLPKAHCNTPTIENPDQVEVFQSKEKNITVVLCPGTLDGEENLITIFSKSRPPQSAKLKPPMGSSRVSEQQIRDFVAAFEAKPEPAAGVETADVHKISGGEFDSCLRNSKVQQPGSYIGESFSKSSLNRGMFEAMTLYACVQGNEILLNPERRIQMVPAAAKIAYLKAACEKKKTVDLPDVVPKAQATYVMVVKCSLLNSLLH